MDENQLIPLLIILGLGGVVIYFLTRQQPIVTPPVTAPPSQCGASYVGAGVSVPCALIGQGIKDLAKGASSIAQPVIHEGSVLASGIKPWEVVVLPVGAAHLTYNGAKQVLSAINPF